jgi:hypothetical protein
MTYTLPCLKSSISFEKLLPRRELESSGLAERVLEQSSERRKSYYSSQTKRQLYTASKKYCNRGSNSRPFAVRTDV